MTNVAVGADKLSRFFNRFVILNEDTGTDETGSSTFRTLTGKVIAASAVGVVLRARGNTTIVEANKIIDIEEASRPRRKRIIRRYVREIGADVSCKQHLADRHGILVSVLNAVDEDTARQMHTAISHDDLGHKHGDRPNRTFVDSGEAETAIEELNDEFDEE